MTARTNSWSVQMLSGGGPVFSSESTMGASIFSSDGRYCFAFLEFQIRIYYVPTRQCIRTIDINMENIIGAVIDPSDENNIVIIKEDGDIIILNWKEKSSEPLVSTRKVEIHQSILSIILVKLDAIYVISGRKYKRAGNHAQKRTIYKISRDSLALEELCEIEEVLRFAVSLDCSKIAFLLSSNEIELVDMTQILKFQYVDHNDHTHLNGSALHVPKLNRETIPFPFKSPVTSLAVSNSSAIAIGTAAGPIQVLYSGLITESTQRLLKWHIDQVKSLEFTPDGSYLLSGGLEKVLVLWQLETGETQFLPRLNGPIEKITIDNNKPDCYSLMLRVTSANSSSNIEDDSFEILVLSSVDLVSRLTVSGVKPSFVNQVKATISKTRKKYSKFPDTFDCSKVRYDYSCVFEVHPKTKELYFPNGASLQAYDLVKNEQSFVQNTAHVIPTGKVRSEMKIPDPSVHFVSFTADGGWMCTFDSVSNFEVDNLFSKDDMQYTLKFWKYIDTQSTSDTNDLVNDKGGYWELVTKIVDPHGNSSPILSLKPVPLSFNNGLGYLTADDKGGLRLWVPLFPKEVYQTGKGNKLQQIAWRLRKSKIGGVVSSDAVDVCWSNDASIIFLGHECSISSINAFTFEEISPRRSLTGSRIRSLSLLDHHLIILSKNNILSYNVLKDEEDALAAKFNTNVGARNLIAIDPINKLVCLIGNYYSTKNDSLILSSKIMIFHPNQLKPLFIYHYEKGISSVRSINSSFVFVDVTARVGLIAGNDGSEFKNDISSIFVKPSAGIVHENTTKRNLQVSSDEALESNKIVDINTFQPVFDNIEGVQIETLFDRIIKVIK
ncbi:uncharacterized protein PRCAT00000584001 [Priceomyces carsonii]|uniref:uncharacterized protein n=1 Tax=Priceomyces carsonii TaxID=28549 RepID=UPI002EDB12E9|nr:unnamed protein product [Priceomyces carsonii]